MAVDMLLSASNGTQSSRIAAMIEMTRLHTRGAVAGLSVEQLDHHHDDFANSIGMLLGHLVFGDISFLAGVLQGRELSAKEESEWGGGRRLWERGRFDFKNRTLEDYLDGLAVYHDEILRDLRGRDDTWLDEVLSRSGGGPTRVSKAYLAFHLFQDENRHQGQILWLLHRLPKYELAFWNRRPADRPPGLSGQLKSNRDI